MIAVRQGSSIEVERFPLPAPRERWLDFLALEHATLAPPVDFEREGDELVVKRAGVTGRRIADGRIAKEHAPLLLLQAAGLCSFLQAFGFSLSEEDLIEGIHDVGDSGPRFWIPRTPRCVSASGPGPAPSAVLAALLHRLFSQGRRISDPAARTLFDRLLASDAPFRRADFWLASVFRSFRVLSGPAAAGARARTIGLAGPRYRGARGRLLCAKARALLEGRAVRVFAAGSSALTPGAALGLETPPDRVAAAARALRAAHEREGGRRPLWIAVEIDRWDLLSRRAFETASQALAAEIEVLEIDESAGAPPRLPDEWRREIFVPCGTISASLRFYERFAELARPEPAAARALAESLTVSAEWAAFVSDPTGDGPFPSVACAPPPSAGPEPGPLEREILEVLSAWDEAVSTEALARVFPSRSLERPLGRLGKRGDVTRAASGAWQIAAAGRGRVHLTAARRRAACLRCATAEADPGRRIELLLDGGDLEEALAAAKRWLGETASATPERWFGLSSRLAAAAGVTRPPWLERLEAEREVAGGRLEDARARLLALADAAEATEEVRRGARLRALEIFFQLGHGQPAGREATLWRTDYPAAPAAERVRALRVEAVSRCRAGEHETALRLLDEAERDGAGEDLEDRLETALARAGVYAAASRFREEQAVYEQWRGAVLERADDRLTARLLAHEALAMSDRREFSAAIARLEEVLAITRDDAAQRSHLLLDLSVALYHAGRVEACRPVLDEAVRLATVAGRGDIAHGARINRLELAIHGAEWDDAAREIDGLLADADERGDEISRLVALHQRGRVALRRGQLEEARRDNEQARALSTTLRDRLEIGELWLEEGDRALYAGDLEGARAAWDKASVDPPDRCDTDLQARERLRELGRRGEGGPPQEDLAQTDAALARGDYAAAERVARWRVLFGVVGVPPTLSARAEEILRGRGGSVLAERVFGPPSGPPSLAAGQLRPLRDAVAAALSGEEVEAPLRAFGLSGLSVRDEEGQTILRWRTSQPHADAAAAPLVRALTAGEARYELELSPPPPPQTADSIAFLLETMLYRRRPAPAPEEFARGWGRFHVVTADPRMEDPYRRLVRFAPQPVTVLVLGESGSGKEAVARAVHQLSSRSSGPFVAVNVPAIPAALLESELFGHVRGAFTGADRDRRGLLEEAAGGTIFFDEIGDLSLPLQAKLLRALQEREIRRVGENRSRSIDVRVVSATSRSLAEDVERGVFREDLYYRLHVAVIALPPLRDRGRDVILLARHFLERYGKEYGRGELQFSPESLAALSAHGWPGNVRELQNAVAQAAALAEPGGSVGVELLPESVRRDRRPAGPTEGYRTRVDAHRRDLISEALERSGGNRTRAARDLGLSRQALLYLIRELNVTSRPRSGH